MIKQIVSRSSHVDPIIAVKEITQTFTSSKLIIFFAPLNNFELVAKEMYEQNRNATVIGMSSLYQIANGIGSENEIIAVSIESGIEVSGGFIPNLNKYPLNEIPQIKKALSSIGKSNGNTACLEFCSGNEEKLMSTFHSVLHSTKIPLAGATAVGELGVSEGFVSFNDQIGRDACAFVFIKNLSGKILSLKENIYKPTGSVFTATKTNTKTRELIELNHKPTLVALSEKLGVPPNKVMDATLTNPLGKIIGDEIFITSLAAPTQNGAASCFKNVLTNDKLALLEVDDYRKVFEDTVCEIKKQIPSPSLTISINCILRYLFLQQEKTLLELEKSLNKLGSNIGCVSFGEQYNYHHVNQTMVTLIFE